MPIATGFVDYFPDAMVAVAELSKAGNEQHNPGTALHWDRSKSGDESDALMRHFLQRGTMDTDGILHSAKVAWRAMALLQKELEAIQDAATAQSVLKDSTIPSLGGEVLAYGMRRLDDVYGRNNGLYDTQGGRKS